MTERRYKCNLCRDELVANQQPALVANTEPCGVGVEFCAEPQRMKFVSVTKAENHVCLKCLRALREEMNASSL